MKIFLILLMLGSQTIVYASDQNIPDAEFWRKVNSINEFQPKLRELIDPAVGLDDSLREIENPQELFEKACLDHQLRINEVIKYLYVVHTEHLEDLRRQMSYDHFFAHAINIVTQGMNKVRETESKQDENDK